MKNISNVDNFVLKFKKPYDKVKNVFIIKSISKNWYEVILFRLGLIKKIKLKLNNGTVVNFDNQESYFNFWKTKDALIQKIKCNDIKKIKFNNTQVQLKYKDKMLRFFYDSEEQLGNTLYLIKEQFIENQYAWLDVKDKDVIDVGANIGDTAIYFALSSAKHVYALEPYPYSYNLARKNIEINNLTDKITLLNYGIGNKNKIKINNGFKSYGGAILNNFSSGKIIKIVTLDGLVKKYNLKNALLKMDCEGGEYPTILNASLETLRSFEKIIIEYHNGYVNLKEKLEFCGFKVNHTFPKFSYTKEDLTTNSCIGLIYAVKLENNKIKN